MVLASTELSQAELNYEAEYEEMFGILARPEPRPTRYFLTTQMRGYVVVIADNYPEAFARLFRQWSPSDNPQDVLDAVVRAVDPPRLRAIEGGLS